MAGKEEIKLDIGSFDEFKALELGVFGAYSRLVLVFLGTKKPVKECDFDRILNEGKAKTEMLKAVLRPFFYIENNCWTPKKDHLYRDLGGENG